MEVQYDNHPAQLRKISADAAHFDRFKLQNGEGILNFWRLERVVTPLFSFFRKHASASWLTIGDGMYGQDANRIMRQGVVRVHASDMSADLLSIGSGRGYIGEYSAQNAEALAFADNSFDFVFCKDSYHHFPRPTLAVYEMLRVCRRAVILLEPSDPALSPNLRSWGMALLGKSFHDFETVGNYVFSISRRELEKLLLGLGLRHCAFKAHDDPYSPEVDVLPAQGGSLSQSLSRLRYKTKCFLRGVLWRLRIIPSNCLIAVLFKTAPTAEDIAVLRQAGFKTKQLPLNPYAPASLVKS
jgi:SAM-dependent methyltransferase